MNDNPQIINLAKKLYEISWGNNPLLVNHPWEAQGETGREEYVNMARYIVKHYTTRTKKENRT